LTFNSKKWHESCLKRICYKNAKILDGKRLLNNKLTSWNSLLLTKIQIRRNKGKEKKSFSGKHESFLSADYHTLRQIQSNFFSSVFNVDICLFKFRTFIVKCIGRGNVNYTILMGKFFYRHCVNFDFRAEWKALKFCHQVFWIYFGGSKQTFICLRTKINNCSYFRMTLINFSPKGLIV